MSGVQRSAKTSAPRDTGQNWRYSGTRTVNASPRQPASSFFGLPPHARSIDRSGDAERHLGGTQMQTRFVLALLAVVAGVAAYGGTGLATPVSGVTSTLLAAGRCGEVHPETPPRRLA